MAKKKADEKFYDEHGECIACGFAGVDLHHIKTQKAGGSNHSRNLMPLCHRHHVQVHTTGLVKFTSLDLKKDGVDGERVVMWLIDNGWHFDDFLFKWLNPEEF